MNTFLSCIFLALKFRNLLEIWEWTFLWEVCCRENTCDAVPINPCQASACYLGKDFVLEQYIYDMRDTFGHLSFPYGKIPDVSFLIPLRERWNWTAKFRHSDVSKIESAHGSHILKSMDIRLINRSNADTCEKNNLLTLLRKYEAICLSINTFHVLIKMLQHLLMIL